MKTLDEWIEYYEKHTGEAFKFKPNFAFFFEPNHGFCEYKAEDTGIYIWQLCGDLDYWLSKAYTCCQVLKLPAICAFILRKPKPFIRRLGFKITSVEEKDGQHRYHAVNKKGEELTATEYGDRYIFTWVVKYDENV